MVRAKRIQVDKAESAHSLSLAVAYLTAQGLSQQAIASRLGLKSQSAVSRLFAAINPEVYITRSFNWNAVTAEQKSHILRLVEGNPLERRLRQEVPRKDPHTLHVHPVFVPYTDDINRKFAAFAPGAATVLCRLLLRVQGPVGVAWGSTLWHVSQALRGIPPLGRTLPVTFVPLCGDPVFFASAYTDRTSSRLVGELSSIINRGETKGDRFWLGVVPAFIPAFAPPHKEAKLKAINELINLVPDYSRIFGPRTAARASLSRRDQSNVLANELNMVITSAGTADHPAQFGEGNRLLGLTSNQQQTLKDSIYGDIGGVFLKKPSLSRTGAKLVADIESRWTGITQPQLRACAGRASPSQPGVVLFCFGGAERVPVVLEAVRQSLVNHLVVGTDLEAALLAALGPA
ncbi:MAG: hypothetical protein U0R19_06230 [Bryobacteraceae bacterium]